MREMKKVMTHVTPLRDADGDNPKAARLSTTVKHILTPSIEWITLVLSFSVITTSKCEDALVVAMETQNKRGKIDSYFREAGDRSQPRESFPLSSKSSVEGGGMENANRKWSRSHAEALVAPW